MELFLLDTKYQFILKMIDEITKTDSREISFVTLADKLNLSKITVATYSKILLDFCQEKNLESFSIQSGKLLMSDNTNFNIFNLYHDFIQKSIKYQIMVTIFKNPDIMLTNLCLDLAISQSACTEHIKQINKFLIPYHCKINFLKRKPIEGEVHHVRYLFYSLFLGLDYDEIDFNSPKLDAFTELLNKFFPNINFAILSKIRLHLYIFQTFSEFGFFINPEIDFQIQDTPFITFDDFYQKMAALNFFEHCPDEETTLSECRYLYFLIHRQNLLTLEVCQDFKHQINSATSPNVQFFMIEFQNSFGLHLQDYELAYLSYNLTLCFQEASIFKCKTKTFGFTKLVNVFNNTIKKAPLSIDTFLNNICDKNKEIKVLIETSPNLHLYCTMLLRPIITNRQQSLKLLVQCGISPLYRDALISQIKNCTSFPIIISSPHELNNEKPDGIISNWLPDKKYKDIPFFSSSFFFTNWNKDNLSQFIDQLIAKKISV